MSDSAEKKDLGGLARSIDSLFGDRAGAGSARSESEEVDAAGEAEVGATAAPEVEAAAEVEVEAVAEVEVEAVADSWDGDAVVLERAEPGDERGTLLGGAVLAATEHNVLCQGDREASGAGPLMTTDSEALLQAGNELAGRTFELLLGELEWTRDAIDRVVTHQVGSAHRRLLFETLRLDPQRDFPTVAELGNVGSVSLPLSLAHAVEAGFVRDGHRVAMLGIGSGLNCLMLGVAW